MRHLTFSLILACLPQLAISQDGPAFDCAAAQSSAEKLVCDDPGLAELDRRLAERFAAALSVARGLDSGAKAAEDELRATQRGWISGRDECWKEPDLGTCVRQQYLMREGELVARYLLEPPTSITEFACGDGGADGLTAYRFDTELPALRIERGDSVGAGAATEPDMPDSYWLTGMGGFTFTENGGEFTDQYGKATECRPAN